MAARDRRTAEQILADRRAKNAEYQRKWRQANPERSAEITMRYLRRKMAQAENTTDNTPQKGT